MLSDLFSWLVLTQVSQHYFGGRGSRIDWLKLLRQWSGWFQGGVGRFHRRHLISLPSLCVEVGWTCELIVWALRSLLHQLFVQDLVRLDTKDAIDWFLRLLHLRLMPVLLRLLLMTLAVAEDRWMLLSRVESGFAHMSTEIILLLWAILVTVDLVSLLSQKARSALLTWIQLPSLSNTDTGVVLIHMLRRCQCISNAAFVVVHIQSTLRWVTQVWVGILLYVHRLVAVEGRLSSLLRRHHLLLWLALITILMINLWLDQGRLVLSCLCPLSLILSPSVDCTLRHPSLNPVPIFSVECNLLDFFSRHGSFELLEELLSVHFLLLCQSNLGFLIALDSSTFNHCLILGFFNRFKLRLFYLLLFSRGKVANKSINFSVSMEYISLVARGWWHLASLVKWLTRLSLRILFVHHAWEVWYCFWFLIFFDLSKVLSLSATAAEFGIPLRTIWHCVFLRLYLLVPVHVAGFDPEIFVLLIVVFFFCFVLLGVADSSLNFVSLLQLVVQVLRHALGFQLWKVLHVNSVHLSSPIINALLRHDNFFPRIEHLRITDLLFLARRNNL